VAKILKMPQKKAENGNLTIEQIQAVRRPNAKEPPHSELTDELDRIRELRKASEDKNS
jgi:hypothetical protein